MENQNGNGGSYPREDRTTMVGTCTSNGRQTNTMSSIDMVPKRWQKWTWKTQKVLERHGNSLRIGRTSR